MSELKVVSLEECLEKVIDYRGRTPKKLGKDWVKNGEYRAISANNVKFDGLIREESIYRGDEELYKLWMKEEVEKGDILLTSEAPSGQAMIWDSDEKIILSQRLYALRVNKNLVDNSYLKYFIQSPLGQKSITRNNSGSTVSGISAKTFKNIKILIPDLENQQAISKFLLTIDQKIQVNNQINQELEAMAKTLYDYWFVQFDFPDQNGKPYKSSGGKMVYNQELKREIPDGWGVEKLGDIANITMGQSPKGTSYNEVGEGMLFFQGSTDFGWRFPVARQYTTEPSRIAEEDDILLSVRAPVGTLNIADTRCCIGRGLAAINSKVGANSYIFNVMQDFKKLFDMMNSVGTTFGSITKDDLYSLQLVYPPNELLMKFDKSVNSFDREIKNRSRQNQELSQLRDWLLPMLMNGQVKVE
ncbi:restriction endonuclease subunit S [Streptococcus thermophilus]|uniref:restriction endonuclease subunit S n=1 Tax=Streptococcus thermophilus TaxID=1308 RepID=UPI00321906AC